MKKKFLKFIAYIESHGPFPCPVCKKKRWLPAKIQTYYVPRMKQNVTSKDKQCYKCRKRLIRMISGM